MLGCVSIDSLSPNSVQSSSVLDGGAMSGSGGDPAAAAATSNGNAGAPLPAVMTASTGSAAGGSLRPPSKLRRPTTLTSSAHAPGPSPLSSGGSGARTPLSAASSLSALNDKS
ncbi:hypothetical protein V5799_009495, partial [Amblyomma americanum]